jgi:hypothetical protein
MYKRHSGLCRTGRAGSRAGPTQTLDSGWQEDKNCKADNHTILMSQT